MKILHFAKITTLASLLAVANISCAADPVKSVATAPTAYNPSTTSPATSTPASTSEPGNTSAQSNTTSTSTEPNDATQASKPAASFKISDRGRLIPVSRDGTPYVTCGKGDKRQICTIFEKKVNVEQLKTITITQITYSASPRCIICCQDFGDGVIDPSSCFVDPKDKNCSKPK